MGLCLSSMTSTERELPAGEETAKVVSNKGELHQYSLPAVASQVLRAEVGASWAPDWFLCNSDLLQYEQCIPPMDPSSHLHRDQMYLVLPRSRLHRKLSASDMAALAVKAALALNGNASSGKRAKKTKPTRISPLLFLELEEEEDDDADSGYQYPTPLATSAKSRAFRREEHNYKRGSRRVKFPAGPNSFRLKLTTIHEGVTLVI